MQELQPPRVLRSVTSSHLTATSRAVGTVEMHHDFNIGPAVRREFLAVTLSVEGCTDLKNIVHFFSMRVTKFCTRGGSTVRSKKWNSKISWLGSVSRWSENGGSQR